MQEDNKISVSEGSDVPMTREEKGQDSISRGRSESRRAEENQRGMFSRAWDLILRLSRIVSSCVAKERERRTRRRPDPS